METILLGQELITLQSVDSTNNYAAKLNKQGVLSDGSVIMAYNQSNGRGQRGNSWQVEPNMNLTFSIFWKSSGILVSEQFKLSMALSLGIINYLNHHQVIAKIKWPNDIYVEDCKIAGMLIENSIQGNKITNSILGVGFNLNQLVFEGFRATSLSKLKNVCYTIVDELHILLSYIEPELMKLRSKTSSNLKEIYFQSLIGYKVPFKFTESHNNEIHEGEVSDVRSNGKLVVLVNNEERKYDLKEIEFKL